MRNVALPVNVIQISNGKIKDLGIYQKGFRDTSDKKNIWNRDAASVAVHSVQAPQKHQLLVTSMIEPHILHSQKNSGFNFTASHYLKMWDAQTCLRSS